MDSATTNDQLSELTRLVEEHQAHLKRHQSMLRQFRSKFFHGQDSKSPCQVVLDQDQLDDLKNLTHQFKTTVDSLCLCLYRMETTKVTRSTGVPEHHPKEENDHWGYQKSLSKAVERWKTVAKKRRENEGCKSLAEWYRDNKELDQKEEEAEEEQEEEESKAFRFIQFVGFDFGSKISTLLVEYFTYLVRSKNQQEIDRKIRLVKTTLRSLSLIGDDNNDNNNNNNNHKSFVVETFIRVVEMIETEIIKAMAIINENNNNNDGTSSCTGAAVLDERTENLFLRTIFRGVLRFEVVFSYPLFGNKMEKQFSLELLRKIMASLALRHRESSSEIRMLAMESWNRQEQNPELQTLHQTLHLQSRIIWTELDIF